jgi:Zn-dependent peptidase ImmA (M78 family)/DNA-binding XRE family transcriptional regulator
MSSQAIISYNVLKWARLRSNFNIELVAKKINVKVEKLVNWEEGVSKPTFNQAQKLAKVLHIPFGYLFLDEPPIEKQILPDLRTVTDLPFDNFSTDLQDVISDVKFKQEWYRDFKIERGDSEIPFIGKYNYNEDSKIIAHDISQMLKLKDRSNFKNWEDFYTSLIKRAEAVGLWVMQSSMVGNNTFRILDVEEFRGFVISDSIAPVIFINGSDAKAAKIFTLVHEIVHLWFASSGVSNIDFRNDKNSLYNDHEKQCNEIAAEILVPEEQFVDKWNQHLPVKENSEILCKYFKVSSVVIARRAFDLGLIEDDEFFDYYHQLLDSWNNYKQKQKEHKGGPDYYLSVPIKNGNNFSYDVIQNVYSQNILMRDGARLLGLTPATLETYAKKNELY